MCSGERRSPAIPQPQTLPSYWQRVNLDSSLQKTCFRSSTVQIQKVPCITSTKQRGRFLQSIAYGRRKPRKPSKYATLRILFIETTISDDCWNSCSISPIGLMWFFRISLGRLTHRTHRSLSLSFLSLPS
ncbi:hypothetical protein TNCV_2541791 [Trichonephila clavipes]|nr:hypothetical protein TNCV_2541791 [Trichonephila clavipes]